MSQRAHQAAGAQPVRSSRTLRWSIQAPVTAVKMIGVIVMVHSGPRGKVRRRLRLAWRMPR